MTELEKINTIRQRNGMLPLEELPKSPEAIEAEKKAAEDAEKQRIAKEEEEKRKQNTPAELDDNTVLAHLKKKGISVESFDDLKPKKSQDEIDAEKQQRESEKLSWGLKNKRFKKEELEGYIVDSKSPQNLIYNIFSEKVKNANPDFTDEQIQEQFKERYGLNKDPDSWEYKQGQEELSLMSTHLLNQKYAPILALDNEYSQYEQQETSKSSMQAKIIANAPAYKKDIESVFDGLKKYKAKVGNEEYEIEVPQDFAERSKAYFLQDETAASHIQKGWTKEEISEVVNNMLLIEHRDYINQQIAEQYHKNKSKGTRGLIPPFTRRGQADMPVDEKLKKAAERHGAVPSTN